MNLRQFYKNQIKATAQAIKVVKPAFRKLQSLNSKNLSDSSEALDLQKVLNDHMFLGSLRDKSRYLNLAYAVIRNKDLSKVETNPKSAHSESWLKKVMEQMETEFNSQKVEVSHE
jgi:hypothetical protein